MKMTQDRVFQQGIWWLAQNTSNETVTDAVRLLGYLCDTTDEWILQAVGRLQDAIAANDRKVQS